MKKKVKEDVVLQLALIYWIPGRGYELFYRYPDSLRLGAVERKTVSLPDLLRLNHVYGLIDEQPILGMPKEIAMALFGPTKNYEQLSLTIQNRQYFTCSQYFSVPSGLVQVNSFSLAVELNPSFALSAKKALLLLSEAIAFEQRHNKIFNSALSQITEKTAVFLKEAELIRFTDIFNQSQAAQKRRQIGEISSRYLYEVPLFERIRTFITSLRQRRAFQFNPLFVVPALSYNFDCRVSPHQTVFLIKNETLKLIGNRSPRLLRFIKELDMYSSLQDIEETSDFALSEMIDLASSLVLNFGAVAGNPLGPFSLFTLNSDFKPGQLKTVEAKFAERQKHKNLFEILQKFNGHAKQEVAKEIEMKIFRLLICNRLIREVRTVLVPIRAPTDPRLLLIWEQLGGQSCELRGRGLKVPLEASQQVDAVGRGADLYWHRLTL